jgi:hypothetical protein
VNPWPACRLAANKITALWCVSTELLCARSVAPRPTPRAYRQLPLPAPHAYGATADVPLAPGCSCCCWMLRGRRGAGEGGEGRNHTCQ